MCWKKVLWKSAAISIAKSLWLHKQLLSTRLQYPGAISSETRETCYCNAKIPERHMIIISHRNVKSKVLSNLFCCIKCHINWYPLIHIRHTTTENMQQKVRIIEKSKCITESFFNLNEQFACPSMKYWLFFRFSGHVLLWNANMRFGQCFSILVLEKHAFCILLMI